MRNGVKVNPSTPASSLSAKRGRKTLALALKEQLEAALNRAAVLAGANAAMAKMISRLAEQPDIRHFVAKALEVFAQEFNAVGAEFWRYDPATDQFTPILSYERATGAVLGADNEWKEMDAKRPASLPEDSHQRDQARRTEVKNGRINYLRFADIESDPVLESFREKLQAQGIRTILSVPLFLKDQCWGTIALRLDHDRTLNPVEEEFAFALAQQVALAFHASRLSEQAKQNALTLERQKAASERAARLAQANQALKASLAQLAKDQDIDSYLGHTLQAITDQLNSPSSTLWKFDRINPNLVSLDLVYEAGKIVSAGRHTRRPEKRVVDNTNHAGHQRVLRGEQFVMDVSTYGGFLPGQREYLEELNVATLLSTPIMVGDRALGVYVAHFSEKRTFDAEELAFIQALSQQTALALEFTRLAEEAKQAAIAREQEEAARQRADVLARANAAMAKTVSRLAEQPDIRHFVGQSLEVFAQEFNAVGAEFWRYDPNAGDFSVALSYERADGVVSGAEKDWNDWNAKKPSRDVAREELVRQRVIAYIRHDEIYSSPILEPFREKLRAGSIRTILSVPIFLKNENLGAICLRLDHDRTLNQAEEEFAFALAQQMALALRMSCLAEEAKQAAVAREQQLAAQQQAAQLAKANEIMRTTVEVMTSIPAIDDLLGRVMQTLNEHMGSPGSTLWLFDARGSDLHLCCLKGEIFQTPPSPDGAQVLRHISRHSGTDAERAFLLRQIHYFDPDPRGRPDLDESTRRWMTYYGAVGLLVIPIRIAHQVIGCLCIHKEDSNPFAPEETEMAVALVQQAALSLHITRLAQKAKQAAIAREQEQAATEKAAELAKANDALRHSVDSLIDLESINDFLGISLRTIADVLGVPSACFWTSRAGFSQLDLVYEEGRIIPGKESNHPNALSPIPHDVHMDYQDGKLKTEPYTVPTDDPSVPFTSEQREMLIRLGVRALINVPIILNGAATARITARLTHEMPDPTPSRIELIRALANQAALALQVSRLAEEAKQAAVAREQQRAAQEKVDELVKANDALRRSVDSLIDLESINDFLGISLRTIADVLGVPSACFWNNQDGLSHLKLVYEENRIIEGKESNHPNAKEPASFDRTFSFDAEGKLRTEPYTTIPSDPNPPFTAAQREMFAKLGVRALVNIPIILKGEAVATVTARLTHDMPDPTPNRIELIRALANQAALALQVSRLAEEARQTAVLGERARIAGEIHDSLAQSFAGISLHLEAAFAAKRKGKKETSDFLENARRMAAFGLAEARSSVLSLKPNVLDQGDLSGMLRQLAERSSVKGHLECEFKEMGKPSILDKEVKHAVFRVVQEALGNALKHAQPKKICFTLQHWADRFSVSIKDDGAGFTATEIKQGFGLRGMRERCEERGGQFQIKSKPGHGTVLSVTFPIAAK